MFPRGISTAALSFGFARPLITYSERARSVASNGIVVIHRGIRSSSEGLPVPPPLQSLVTSQDTQAARGWLEKFKGVTIPKDVVEVTFSRSSGPGGQVRVFIYRAIAIADMNVMTFSSEERQQGEYKSNIAMPLGCLMDSSVGKGRPS